MSRTGWAVLAGVAATAGAAPAQYLNGYNPAFGVFSFRNQQSVYNFTFNPRVGVVSVGYAWLPGPYFYNQNPRTVTGGTAAGTVGLVGTPYAPGLVRHSEKVARAQRRAQADLVGGGGPAARPDLGGKPAIDNAPKPVDLPLALTEPDADAVASGRTLNDLVGMIRTLEAKGAKADAPLIPADALAKLAPAAGPAGDALVLLWADDLPYPDGVLTNAYAMWRADLNRAFDAVRGPLAAGKKSDPVTAGRLAAAADRFRTAAKDVPGVEPFCDKIVSAAKFLAEPAADGLFVPAWATTGATAAELVKHSARYRLAFGPAPAGSEDAYAAVHRGLVAYYAGLAAVKK